MPDSAAKAAYGFDYPHMAELIKAIADGDMSSVENHVKQGADLNRIKIQASNTSNKSLYTNAFTLSIFRDHLRLVQNATTYDFLELIRLFHINDIELVKNKEFIPFLCRLGAKALLAKEYYKEKIETEITRIDSISSTSKIISRYLVRSNAEVKRRKAWLELLAIMMPLLPEAPNIALREFNNILEEHITFLHDSLYITPTSMNYLNTLSKCFPEEIGVRLRENSPLQIILRIRQCANLIKHIVEKDDNTSEETQRYPNTYELSAPRRNGRLLTLEQARVTYSQILDLLLSCTEELKNFSGEELKKEGEQLEFCFTDIIETIFKSDDKLPQHEKEYLYQTAGSILAAVGRINNSEVFRNKCMKALYARLLDDGYFRSKSRIIKKINPLLDVLEESGAVEWIRTPSGLSLFAKYCTGFTSNLLEILVDNLKIDINQYVSVEPNANFFGEKLSGEVTIPLWHAMFLTEREWTASNAKFLSDRLDIAERFGANINERSELGSIAEILLSLQMPKPYGNSTPTFMLSRGLKLQTIEDTFSIISSKGFDFKGHSGGHDFRERLLEILSIYNEECCEYLYEEITNIVWKVEDHNRVAEKEPYSMEMSW